MSLRRAGPGDAAKLALVGSAGFLESFADDHPGDDLVAHCAKDHGEAYYSALLADPACALWIVEAPLGAPVGYAALTPATLPGAVDGDVELKRIYMLAPWHGCGMSRTLIEAVIAEARGRGFRRLLLAVYAQNSRARAFYARSRFGQIGETVFAVGAAIFTDIVMAREL